MSSQPASSHECHEHSLFIADRGDDEQGAGIDSTHLFMITKHDQHLLELPAMPIFEAFGQDRFPDERSGYLDYRADVYGSVHDFEVYSQVDFLML